MSIVTQSERCAYTGAQTRVVVAAGIVAVYLAYVYTSEERGVEPPLGARL